MFEPIFFRPASPSHQNDAQLMEKDTAEPEVKMETPEIPEPEGLKQLRKSFAKIYDGPDSLRRTYDMIEEAKCLNLPLDTYRYLYDQRSEEPLPPHFSQNLERWGTKRARYSHSNSLRVLAS